VPNWMRLTSDRIVGRGAELDAAVAAVGRVRDGLPGVITVSVEAGIGKTRFVIAVADRLQAEGTRVLTGACLDLGAGALPYSAFIAAFRSVDREVGGRASHRRVG
jgi:predicted ATPase